MSKKGTYFPIILWMLLGTQSLWAQKLPKEFVELNANIGFGNKITQSNIYYGRNFSFYNHSRFYFTSGVRLSVTNNIGDMNFSDPQPSMIVLNSAKNGVWITSLNIAFGLSCAISEDVYVSLGAEVLGMSLLSELNGTISNKGISAPFTSQSSATNVLLNPANLGNLQNQLMFNFKASEHCFLNAVVANQRSQVDYTSTLPDYSSFSLSDNTFLFMAGVQWRFVKIKKAP